MKFSIYQPWLSSGWKRLSTWRRTEPTVVTSGNDDEQAPAVAPLGNDDRARLVQRFLDQGRTAILLRGQIAKSMDAGQLRVVRSAFLQSMIPVEAGDVAVAEWSLEDGEQQAGLADRRSESVAAYFLDRCAVTNRQFREFVADGGYGQQSLWDAAIWPRISEFLDRTGEAGPRYWRNGQYAASEAEFPVVGVSWYEADAFARWAGRRLPTDAEWIKGAACPATAEGGETVQRRLPWGDTPDARRANLWFTGLRNTARVADFASGSSGIGAMQMIGNVWEWTSSDLRITSYGRDVRFGYPLKCLRGGAFDTYFENQVSCQTQSGDSPLARRHNVGFRCALTVSDIAWEEKP